MCARRKPRPTFPSSPNGSPQQATSICARATANARSSVDSDWSKGGRIVYAYPDGSVAADGEVLDIDPGRFVRMSFHARWDPETEAGGPVTMLWDIEPQANGGSKLTVTTSGLVPGTKIATEFSGGIVFIVSGLKTYVETGAPMSVPAEVS